MSVEMQDLLLSDFISTGVYWLAVLTCAVCLGLQLVLLCLRLWMSRLETIPSRPSINFKQPTYSVHLAIHNEPPAVVIKSLRALAGQDWPAEQYEVIVIDNNTVDPLLWQPVAATCTELGSQFRFYHRMGVIGAKAGALNIALLETRQDASHIVTVDADYVTDPQFLGSRPINRFETVSFA
jgi:cellulose synthase/poly-beta-1,6-N-acetylglucosamine synthase-like glycosyltransferase